MSGCSDRALGVVKATVEDTDAEFADGENVWRGGGGTGAELGMKRFVDR